MRTLSPKGNVYNFHKRQKFSSIKNIVIIPQDENTLK